MPGQDDLFGKVPQWWLDNKENPEVLTIQQRLKELGATLEVEDPVKMLNRIVTTMVCPFCREKTLNVHDFAESKVYCKKCGTIMSAGVVERRQGE